MKNVNAKGIENAKEFWKTYKPYLSHNQIIDDKIILLEEDKIVSDDLKISEIFNEYFTNITKNLNTEPWPSDYTAENDPVKMAMHKYRNHPSIITIKEKMKFENNKFHFSHVLPEQVLDQIMLLKSSKKTRGKIPVKILKILQQVNLNHLTDCINNAIHEGKFPNELKLADITVAFKQDDPTSKKYYRPISILEAYSKVYERIFAAQINSYMFDKLSEKLCGFRKGHSTQHLLLKLVEKWRKTLDNKGTAGTILMDLSKAFDSLPHDLLIAKLEAYGFSLSALTLLNDYLSNRLQRVKIGSVYSTWRKIIAGIPQGSILGPLLFNIFINDIFYQLTDLTNFADDNTIDACSDNVETVITKLEKDMITALNWFKVNKLVVNPGKFQLMFLGVQNNQNYCLQVPENSRQKADDSIKFVSENCLKISGKIIIKARNNVKLLGVLIDHQLNFNLHIDKLCSKARNSVNALQRISGYTSTENLKLLINTFFMSSFSYCPLIWTFCTKTKNNKINALHKRALQLISPKEKSFDQLLLDNNMITVHKRNLQIMMTEIYCSINKLNPSFLWGQIQINNNRVNRRNGTQLLLPHTNTVSFGMKSYTFRGSILWNYLPAKIKSSVSLSVFKDRIKTWTGTRCQCSLCT